MDSPLIPKLNAVRRRHAAVAAGTAGVAVFAVALLCLSAGMLLDRWLDLPLGTRRVLLWVDAVALLAVLVWRGAWPTLVRGPDLHQAALWVERAVPAFASQLISAVQFLRPVAEVPSNTSAGMVRALVRQAEAAAAEVDFVAVVPVRDLKRLTIAAAAVLVCVFAGFLYGGWTSVALAERALLIPGVPFPHRTHVAWVGGDLVVAQGDPVTLSATATGVVPEAGTVSIRYGSGARAELPVSAAGDRFDRPIDNVQEPFVYRFSIGDDQSAECHVRTAVRPAVVGVRCRVTPPAYTGLPAAERSPWDLSLLNGSTLGLTVMSNVPCFGIVRFAGTKAFSPLLGAGTTLASADTPVPPGATGFTVELLTADGLRSRDPVVYRIDTVADRPPTVRLVTPAGDGTVTPVARPTVTVEADDDFGVARLSLRYRITHAGQSTAVDDDPNGLVGTYGPGAGVTRVDPDLDLSWAATPPPAGVAVPFPVRWAGTLRPAVSDDYWFTCHVTGGGTFTIAGRTLISRPGQGEEGPVRLQAGRLYPISLSCPTAGVGEARLSWRGRRVPTQVVPHACLYRRADAYEPPPDSDGLVGYWPMAESDADAGFVRDGAGAADGTVYDAVTRVPGRVGRALAFAEPGDRGGAFPHVEIPTTTATQFRADESYTLAAWVNLQQLTGHPQGLVTKSKENGAYYGIGLDAEGHVLARANGGNLVGPIATPGWHHVVVVQDGPARLRTLYVDDEGAVTGKSQDGSGPGVMILGNVRSGVEPFVGWLDDVRVYARAMPAEQVRDMLANPRPVHVPTPAEVGGLSGGGAAVVPIELPGRPAPHVQRRLAWDLSALPSPPAVGDAIDLWAEAADGNTVTGPGTAASDHCHLRVVDEAEKRRELMGRLGDYLGRVNDVADDQRDLTAQVGTMVAGPATRPGQR